MTANEGRPQPDALQASNARDALLGLAVTRVDVDNDCLDAGTLVAFHERSLNRGDTQAASAHLAHCERCFDTWVALSEALPNAVPAQRVGWWQRTVDLVRNAPQWQPALAATFVIALGIGIGTRIADQSRAPIAGYELSLQGSAQSRGDNDQPDARMTLTAGDRFELMLRPHTTVDDTLDVRLYTQAGNVVTPLQSPAAVALGAGTLTVHGRLGLDVTPPSGRSQLIVVLGRRGKLPDAQVVGARLGEQARLREDDWQAWQIPIHFVPR